MITISNCPVTGLERKLDYNFFWLKMSNQIVLRCRISYFKDGVKITSNGLNDYHKELIASDSLVNNTTGYIYTKEEIAELTEEQLQNDVTTEYDFYANVLGSTPIVLPTIIENIIAQRDEEKKFD